MKASAPKTPILNIFCIIIYRQWFHRRCISLVVCIVFTCVCVCMFVCMCVCVCVFACMCVCVCVQWRREQEFDLQLLERAVQGEEARGEEGQGEEVWEPERRSVQGEEGPPEEHQERPRSRSDEWLTFRAPEPLATAGTPPHQLEPLEYDLDLSKEVQWGLHW